MTWLYWPRATPVVQEIIAKTKNEQVLFMQLDLSSFPSVNRFSKEFLEKEKRLDILINNAGMIGAAEPQQNENGIELTLAVNHLGPFLLTKNLLDLLLKTGPGTRIINVASLAHAFANPAAFQNLDDLTNDGTKGNSKEFILELRPLSPNFIIDHLPQFVMNSQIDTLLTMPAMVRYCNSKLANILFTKELAKRVKSHGILAYSLHPGAIQTEFGIDRQTNQHFDAMGNLMMKLPSFLNPFAFFFKTVEGGAQTTICCAVSDKIGMEQSGGYFADCELAPVKRPEMNDEFAAHFYEWSDGIVRHALGEDQAR